jgi:heme-degrading monooxygenase HmoA
MAHARVTRIEGSADRLDEMTSQFEERTVPALEGLDGYEGYVLLGDRQSGAAMAVTYWASEDALQASEDAVKEERERAAQTAGATSSPSIERFEVLAKA